MGCLKVRNKAVYWMVSDIYFSNSACGGSYMRSTKIC